jgi:hypothetical protein
MNDLFRLEPIDRIKVAAALVVGFVVLTLGLWGIYFVAALLAIPWYVMGTSIVLAGHLLILGYTVDLFERGLDEALVRFQTRMILEADKITSSIRSLRYSASDESSGPAPNRD